MLNARACTLPLSLSLSLSRARARARVHVAIHPPRSFSDVIRSAMIFFLSRLHRQDLRRANMALVKQHRIIVCISGLSVRYLHLRLRLRERCRESLRGSNGVVPRRCRSSFRVGDTIRSISLDRPDLVLVLENLFTRDVLVGERFLSSLTQL